MICNRQLPKEFDSLNFDYLIKRVVYMHGYSRKQAEKLSHQYKNFLFLIKKYDGHEKIIPSQEIDDFWHEHILYTVQYRKDSEMFLGKYLEHKPDTPWRGREVLEEYERQFSRTQELYKKEFGDYIYMVRPFSLGHMVRQLKYRLRSFLIKNIYWSSKHNKKVFGETQGCNRSASQGEAQPRTGGPR